MNKINWSSVTTIGIIVLIAFLIGISLFGGGRSYVGWGMMGPGMMGGWGYSPFAWIGMIFMWLIPIGFLVLTVLGIVWLVRAVGGATQPLHRVPAHPADAAFRLTGATARIAAQR